MNVLRKKWILESEKISQNFQSKCNNKCINNSYYFLSSPAFDSPQVISYTIIYITTSENEVM